MNEIHYTEVGSWFWPNFTPKEISCKGDGLIVINKEALDALQRLRMLVGKPIIINSGYRSAAYNKAVGGAKNSYHMKGMAFDIRLTPDVKREKIHQFASSAGFNGIGDYDTFVHVDTRETKYYWDNRT